MFVSPQGLALGVFEMIIGADILCPGPRAAGISPLGLGIVGVRATQPSARNGNLHPGRCAWTEPCTKKPCNDAIPQRQYQPTMVSTMVSKCERISSIHSMSCLNGGQIISAGCFMPVSAFRPLLRSGWLDQTPHLPVGFVVLDELVCQHAKSLR